MQVCGHAVLLSAPGPKAASQLVSYWFTAAACLLMAAYAVPPCKPPLEHAGRAGSAHPVLSSSQPPAGSQFMPTRSPTAATFSQRCCAPATAAGGRCRGQARDAAFRGAAHQDSAMDTIEQAASKAQRCQKPAAQAEMDGQPAVTQPPAASEKACVMDTQQVPADHGTPLRSAGIQEPPRHQDMREPSSMQEALDVDMAIASSAPGGAGPQQTERPIADAPGLVLQQQASEPELELLVADMRGLAQHPVQARNTAAAFVNNQTALVHRHQLMHRSQQAVIPTKQNHKPRWRRYGRFWKLI